MTRRVVVDRQRCVGSAQCIQVAPDVFDQDEDDGLVVLLVEQPEGHLLEAALRAERQCPAAAIRVEDSSV